MLQLNHILYVITDISNFDPHIKQALELAKLQQAKLSFLYVIPEQQLYFSRFLEKDSSTLISKTQEHIHSIIKKESPEFNGDITVCEGKPFIKIIQHVLQANIDLVIKPIETTSWIDRLLGSQDMHLLRKCPAPVWLVKDELQKNGQSIIASIDFDEDDTSPLSSELNIKIIKFATALALSSNSKLNIVHAWESLEEGFLTLWAENPEKMRETILREESDRQLELRDHLIKDFKNLVGQDSYDYIKPKFLTLQGKAEHVIVEQTNQLKADLIVMGTVARTGIPGFFMGNTAETILSGISCSVLAIKPDGFSTPITIDADS